MAHDFIENKQRIRAARHAAIVDFLMTADREILADRAKCSAGIEHRAPGYTTAEFAAAAADASLIKARAL